MIKQRALFEKLTKATLFLSVCLGALFLGSSGLSLAQESIWSEPVNLSHTSVGDALSPDSAWFPDLAVDSLGRVHLIWCLTTRLAPGEEARTLEILQNERLGERLFYKVWDGQLWSEPNDLVPPSINIVRNAITVDRNDVLHLVYQYKIVGLGGSGIYYTYAPAETAWSTASWSVPRLVSAKGQSYATDLAVDGNGVLHVVFDDTGDLESRVCPGCADIYYRRSTDKGQTWSPPINLSRTPTGSSHEQIEIDSSGTIHVTWDEGWDRITGRGSPLYSVYTFSSDGGLTWHQPIPILYPVSTTAQLAVGANGQGEVMLVWRVTSPEHNGIYYQWSSDQGQTWNSPKVIPGIFAGPWISKFDMYDMAADSAGHIHLVVVGQLSPQPDAPPGVYHLEWDGSSWSAPEGIYQREDFPEYPKIVISHGNQLHVAWFTRPEQFAGGGFDVWYSRSQLEAPYQLPAPTPTAPPAHKPKPAGTTSGSVTPTPFPTLVPGISQLPSGLYTENDELLQLAIGLSPIPLIAGIILLLKRLRRWR